MKFLNADIICVKCPSFQTLHKTAALEEVLMSPVDSNGNTIAHIAAEGNHVSVFKVYIIIHY